MSSVGTNKLFNESPIPMIRQKQIPIKIIFTEDQETSASERVSSTEDAFLVQGLGEKSYYPFSILKSRKKEKKYLRKKYNTIISRVHNMDCLLKKIKA